MTIPVSQVATRKCAGCGYRFRSFAGELYCSQICAGRDAMGAVYGALGRFAAGHPSVPGSPVRRTA